MLARLSICIHDSGVWPLKRSTETVSLTKSSFLQAVLGRGSYIGSYLVGNVKGTPSVDNQLEVRVGSLERTRTKEEEVVPHNHMMMIQVPPEHFLLRLLLFLPK